MIKRSRIVAFFLLLILIGGTIGLTSNTILNNIKLGLDLQGGFEVLYEVNPAQEGQEITPDVVSDTAEALDRRVNVLGVNEPVIQVEDGNRIRVQLAGVEDQDQAREILSTEANLTFRDVNDEVKMTGADLVEGGATQTFDPNNNQPIVQVELKDADQFGQITQEILAMAPQNQLVIWLDYEEGDSYQEEVTKEDPKFISAPNVSEVLNTDTVTITGNFTLEEANNLADLLSAGSLPVELEEVYSDSVGASFGLLAMEQTILAGIIGVALIFLFMIAFYRFPGLIGIITLSVYIYLILLIFDWVNGVLTLPGIAALILGVGMAIDANIITYERMKEELRIGRSVRDAWKKASSSSLLTIVDANVTTMLAGIVLFTFGTSSVKGFATMLLISIVTSFITAVFGTRLFMSLWIRSKFLDQRKGWFGVKKSEILEYNEEEEPDSLDLPTKFDRFDFVKVRKRFFILSGVLLVAGLTVLLTFRLNLGIDFTEGSRMEVLSDTPLTNESFAADIEEAGYEPSNVVVSGNNQEIGVARFSEELSQTEIAELRSYFTEAYGSDPNISTVNPVIGEELARNALMAVAIASIGIILYVTLRFEWQMATASIVALVHDAFFIIAIFSLTRLEVDVTFIAAVLTVIGYSINDTIVTFDRIRENMRKMKRIEKKEELAAIVNKSLRQTLGRSVNTVLTVVFVVVALILFGATSILNFSIALLVGLIAGTYSSVFIASQLWYVLKKRQLKKKGVLITFKEKKEWTDEPVV
ncbi:protein translocase subunit SecDF [Jeotgalibacillus haloalkalitolerans]|uniref:Multifunctional fusion protein n=1 Tax=Jeotgalibacillus haloalkalitolerans TaxID=3104292 RepID=A0ABU5KMD5_9BACL|nr:protein translocase subunit SecDF [Jeotgalibacillus sp. HH7-29]MDZ5712330.1 protein translocase subunit SecDF [Jeotgalibacillus sp. HH7-29]